MSICFECGKRIWPFQRIGVVTLEVKNKRIVHYGCAVTWLSGYKAAFDKYFEVKEE